MLGDSRKTSSNWGPQQTLAVATRHRNQHLFAEADPEFRGCDRLANMTSAQFWAARNGTVGSMSELLAKWLRHTWTRVSGRGQRHYTVNAPALLMDPWG